MYCERDSRLEHSQLASHRFETPPHPRAQPYGNSIVFFFKYDNDPRENEGYISKKTFMTFGRRFGLTVWWGGGPGNGSNGNRSSNGGNGGTGKRQNIL